MQASNAEKRGERTILNQPRFIRAGKKTHRTCEMLSEGFFQSKQQGLRQAHWQERKAGASAKGIGSTPVNLYAGVGL